MLTNKLALFSYGDFSVVSKKVAAVLPLSTGTACTHTHRGRKCIAHSRPNEAVGAAPVCPPERPRSGVSITKTHALYEGMNDGCALVGRHGRAHRHRPYQSPSYFSTQSHTNEINRPTRNLPKRNQPPAYNPSLPISIKPRGVPLPRSGYTFDSAGLASATQPTLGNNASEEATPLGVVLFLIAHHHHMRRMDYSRMISRMQIDFKKYNAHGIGSPPRLYPG